MKRINLLALLNMILVLNFLKLDFLMLLYLVWLVYHIRDHRKKALYPEILSMLRPGGIFCNLDHVASSSVILSQHFRKRMGSQKPVNREHEERLSSIEEQIDWLKQIGFVDIGCYWKWLQFALLIGFKPNKQK